MINLPLRYRGLLSRFAVICLLAFGLLTMSGCASLFGVKKVVKVSPLLGPLTEASTAQLIAEINRISDVRSIRGKVDIEFQDTSFAETGIAEKYRTAEGSVILQRPGQVYLTINGPFAIDIAQMTSDGEHFRIAVLKGDEKFRRFVRGTNSAVYPKLEVDDKEDGGDKKKSERRAVSALSNLRPQHLTDALLIQPVQPRAESGFAYAQSEFYQEEPDTRPRAGKDARVVRGYFLLDELAPGSAGGIMRLARRFWFDRVGGIRFARLQTFDDKGMLITDVTYGEQQSFGEGGSVMLPVRVELTRPHDRYKLKLTYQSPESVVINKEYDPEVFVLQNKWQLPEVNLDARGSQQTQGKQ